VKHDTFQAIDISLSEYGFKYALQNMVSIMVVTSPTHTLITGN